MIMNSKERLHVELSVLGQLYEGDKLNIVEGNLAIEPRARLQGIWRMISGTSRTETIDRVWNIVVVDMKEAIDVAKRGGHDDFDRARLVEGISNALHGVNMLHMTYKTDSITRARLVFLRNKLEHFNKEMGIVDDDKVKPSVSIT